MLHKIVNGEKVPLTAQEKADFYGREAIHREKLKTRYQNTRRNLFPRIDELVVALWELIVEDRPEAVDALQTKRLEVKIQNPKPGE